jgi:hypothetical protein
MSHGNYLVGVLRDSIGRFSYAGINEIKFQSAIDGCYHIMMPLKKNLIYVLLTVSDFFISLIILLSTVYHRSHSVSVEKQRSIPLSFWKLTVRQQDGLPISPSAIFGAPFKMLDTSAKDASLCLLSFVL